MFFQPICTGLCGFAAVILYIINSILVPVIFAVAFLMLVYGIASTYIFSNGEPGAVAKGHQIILWGVIGFAVMVSIWGLVNVVATTFNLSGGTINQPLPTAPIR